MTAADPGLELLPVQEKGVQRVVVKDGRSERSLTPPSPRRDSKAHSRSPRRPGLALPGQRSFDSPRDRSRGASRDRHHRANVKNGKRRVDSEGSDH
ncbi:hypothetical protein VP01_1675g3 [Puccinia sorghi]|uniref:Uncharacterized protein n=1 Tax=Puccinia sorghi TaxID=27349 RepID=A0A0L6VGM1_9BASI|nr:hypothetical protein VP01_1675g3 [Puccinia sorghi]